MLILPLLSHYWRRFAKVYAYCVVLTQWRSVEQLPLFDRGFNCRVRYNYSAERAEGGEGIERRGRAQESVDVLEILGKEC